MTPVCRELYPYAVVQIEESHFCDIAIQKNGSVFAVDLDLLIYELNRSNLEILRKIRTCQNLFAANSNSHSPYRGMPRLEMCGNHLIICDPYSKSLVEIKLESDFKALKIDCPFIPEQCVPFADLFIVKEQGSDNFYQYDRLNWVKLDLSNKMDSNGAILFMFEQEWGIYSSNLGEISLIQKPDLHNRALIYAKNSSASEFTQNLSEFTYQYYGVDCEPIGSDIVILHGTGGSEIPSLLRINIFNHQIMQFNLISKHEFWRFTIDSDHSMVWLLEKNKNNNNASTLAIVKM